MGPRLEGRFRSEVVERRAGIRTLSEGNPSFLARGDPDGEAPSWPNRSRRGPFVGDDEVDGRPLAEGLNLDSKGED